LHSRPPARKIPPTRSVWPQMHRCFPRPAPVLAPVPLLLRHDQASSHSNASTSAAIRCGLVSGRRDRSASSAAPSRSYRAFQPYTDCREAPYRAATSATGDPLRTSSTACRRCSPSHLLPSEDSSRSPATKAINDRRSQMSRERRVKNVARLHTTPGCRHGRWRWGRHAAHA